MSYGRQRQLRILKMFNRKKQPSFLRNYIFFCVTRAVELKYINEAYDTNRMSTIGENINGA